MAMMDDITKSGLQNHIAIHMGVSCLRAEEAGCYGHIEFPDTGEAPRQPGQPENRKGLWKNFTYFEHN
jgi:hypothetical protein